MKANFRQSSIVTSSTAVASAPAARKAAAIVRVRSDCPPIQLPDEYSLEGTAPLDDPRRNTKCAQVGQPANDARSLHTRGLEPFGDVDAIEQREHRRAALGKRDDRRAHLDE